ncbi:MAG TPA: hypothetical protein VGA13_13360 [Acidimicrobiales bacterium]
MDHRQLARAHWDRLGAWFAIIIGALLLVAGWVGASGEELPAGQLPFLISGGLGGLLLVGVGAMLWLSADLRDEWRKLDELDERLASAGIGPPLDRDRGRWDSTPTPPSDEAASDAA